MSNALLVARATRTEASNHKPILGLTSNERDLLARYWRSRGEGEMGAVLAFGYVVEDLVALGSPEPVVTLAKRAVEDERKHALWGRDWAVFFGHPDDSVPVASRTRRLVFPEASAHENRVLRVAFCCMTETVGCHVLKLVRSRIVHPGLRELNRRHLSDELQHARVGWAHLSTLRDRDRALLRDWLPVLSRLVAAACCEGPEMNDHDRLVPYGYFTPEVLYTAHRQALHDVIGPGLAHLGIAEAA